MEEQINIPLSDGKKVYGVINKTINETDKLVIFVHGFTGHPNEHFLYNAAKFFTNKGLDTFRFSFYSDNTDARKLTETSFSEHIKDLEVVTNYFKDQYTSIYLVGHSLGAEVIIYSSADDYQAVVLWEPARDVKDLCLDLEFNKEIDCYIEHSNVDILVGKNFVTDAENLPTITPVIKSFNKPIKIIGAELAGAKIAEELYFNNANNPKEIYIIKNSGHTFDENGAEEELFRETFDWMGKY